jgi:hypothetical protein
MRRFTYYTLYAVRFGFEPCEKVRVQPESVLLREIPAEIDSESKYTSQWTYVLHTELTSRLYSVQFLLYRG